MRCRRSKQLNSERLVSLTSNDEIISHHEYVIMSGTDLLNIMDSNDSEISFDRNINLQVNISAQDIYNYSSGEHYEGEFVGSILNLSSISMRFDGEGVICDIESSGGVYHIVNTHSFIIMQQTHFILNTITSLATSAYMYLFVFVPLKRVLAFFGSYGANESLEEVTANLNTAAVMQYIVFKKDSLFLEGQAFVIDDASIGKECEITYGINTSDHCYVVIIFEDGSYLYESNIQSETLQFTPTASSFKILFGQLDNASQTEYEQYMTNSFIHYYRIKHSSIKTDDGKTFAEAQEGVACSLTQRLSIIKGELWYQIQTGLPLFDKSVSVTTLDSWIIKTIMLHPDVKSILTFNSKLEQHSYQCAVTIMTKYGQVELSV